MAETHNINTLVIGGGQAGMSASYCLKQRDIDHLVLEQSDTIANAWRKRWDSFCLVTPNWQCQLPGHAYEGNDPDGFMLKNEIIDYLESYATKFQLPIQQATKVNHVSLQGHRFRVQTSQQNFLADNIIIATGNYHLPQIPAVAKNLPNHIRQIHSSEYRHPKQFEGENVLLVGTAQSGCQIAEELHAAGNTLYISVGSAPRVNRRYKGRDVIKWLDDMGYYKLTVEENPNGASAAFKTNHCVSGKGGGLDINMRTLAEEGAKLFSRIIKCDGDTCFFANDLIKNLDEADKEANSILSMINKFINENNIDTPADDNIYPSYVPEVSTSLNLSEQLISSIIWCTGFKPDYHWLNIPVLTANGRPIHKNGISSVTGLYFLGLNWQRYWGSGRFYQVGLDAQYICNHILPQD